MVTEPPEQLSDILIAPESKERQLEKFAREWGIIVAMGKTAFKERENGNADEDIKIGDMAVFKSYSGQHFEIPGTDSVLRIMNDTNIWGCIPEEDLEEEGYDADYSDECKEAFRAQTHYHNKKMRKE